MLRVLCVNVPFLLCPSDGSVSTVCLRGDWIHVCIRGILIHSLHCSFYLLKRNIIYTKSSNLYRITPLLDTT